jgi:hypothetical protein
MIAAGVALNDATLRRRGLDLLAWLVDYETADRHLSPTPSRAKGPGTPVPPQQALVRGYRTRCADIAFLANHKGAITLNKLVVTPSSTATCPGFDRRAGIDRLGLALITDRDCSSPDVATAAHVVAVRAPAARAAIATARNVRLGRWPGWRLLNVYILISVWPGTVWSSCHVHSLEHCCAHRSRVRSVQYVELTVRPAGGSRTDAPPPSATACAQAGMT